MMKGLAGDCDDTSLYSVKHIKNLEKYGNRIFFADVKGRKILSVSETFAVLS